MPTENQSSTVLSPRRAKEFWDKLNALPRYMFLLKPSDAGIQKLEDRTGNWIDVYEAQQVVDQAQEEINQLRAERDALQLRLNAADQRIDELTSTPLAADEGEPPIYKPGLYAVRHIDNWDGERDVVLTFAMLDADGKWTDKETGDALLAYRGDKVLRAWPLDCSDAPDTQVIGVPRNWLEDWALELVEAAQDGGQMSNQVEHLLEIHA
jgi:hypothetical protein